MSNVVSYSDFFWLRELHKQVKQFEKEDNQEVVLKLKNNLRFYLTSLGKCAKDTRSPAALMSHR